MIDTLPAWLREVDVALAANPQILLTGRIRDVVLLPQPGLNGPPRQESVVSAVVGQLRIAGHTRVIVADPVEGVRVGADEGEVADRLAAGPAERFTKREPFVSILVDLFTAVVQSTNPCCLVLDSASRLVPASDYSDPDFHRFVITAEKLMLTARRNHVPGPHRTPLYNTVVWLLDREGDVPYWLTSSQRARVVSVPSPTLAQRYSLTRYLLGWSQTDPEAGEPAMIAAAQRFAELSDGLSLRSLLEINRLLIDRQIPHARIDDGIRMFRVGVPDNPWQTEDLRKRIRAGTVWLGERVLGQPVAIQKAVDILTRSAMGLTGAQTRNGGTRPQGVLFFAGPTGVGKTELAKSIAELVFGRVDSFVRFDMSEFSSEHAEARLIGAPPGYTGFGSGGELTNSIRQQPFRLILFDEIEKAHPRILDKFLQILEDGRLTDGTGATVFFSEALIVFTSNLGVYRTDERGNRIPVVQPGDYREVEAAVRSAIADHFTKEIGRPELLNRIGDNVVVFDFIGEATAHALLSKLVENVTARVRDQTGIEVSLQPYVIEQLFEEAQKKLEFGGRGVSNTVESLLVNPLARALFALPETTKEVTVHRLGESACGREVILE